MNTCTDSNDGRRLETSLDSWLESEPPFPPGNFSRVVAPGDGHAPGRGVPACGTARAGACWLLIPFGIAEMKLFSSFLAREGEAWSR